MRLHPYHAERILARPAALARIGRVAASHHERLDGSGYFKGLRGNMLDGPARVLMAAHRYCSLREARPHRAACSAQQACEALMHEARAGRFAADAVNAVLACAGHTER